MFLIKLLFEKRQACRLHSWVSACANRSSIGLFLVELLASLSQRSKCSNYDGLSNPLDYEGYVECFNFLYDVPHIFANRMIYNMSMIPMRLMVSLRLRLR